MRNTCVQLERPSVEIVLPTAGFQYAANEVQLEGKTACLPLARRSPKRPSSCQRLAVSRTQPASLRSPKALESGVARWEMCLEPNRAHSVYPASAPAGLPSLPAHPTFPLRPLPLGRSAPGLPGLEGQEQTEGRAWHAREPMNMRHACSGVGPQKSLIPPKSQCPQL